MTDTARIASIVAAVNPPPRTPRAERARDTRLRILASARVLFVERGYPTTTMSDIASAAGVAVQTVYYSFKTKSLLLRDVVELAGAGRPDEPPVPDRQWMREVLAQSSGDRALALAVEHGVDIYARTAPLWPALYAAAVTDPDVETYFRSLAANRRAGMLQLVRRLQEIGYLRSEFPADRAADIVFTLFSHETYLALTRDADWSVEQYKAWLWRTLVTQLSDADASATDAVRGLSFENLD
jgi:TetR/AcrR family transcriptional regulator, regulator of autoinduction and epiphytic fitness